MPKHIKILIAVWAAYGLAMYFGVDHIPTDYIIFLFLPFMILSFCLGGAMIQFDRKESYERHIARLREEMRKIIQEEND